MDIGKAKLSVSTTYGGVPDAAFEELYRGFWTLSREFAITAGLANLVTSVNIARGQAVNVLDGVLRLADASLSRAAIGICTKAAAAGQKAQIILGMGYAFGLAGLTANSSVYLGSAGALVFAKPVGFIQGLGFSLSATEMFVTISQPS